MKFVQRFAILTFTIFQFLSQAAAEGPFSGKFGLASGELRKSMLPETGMTSAGSDWTMNFWIHPAGQVPARALLAGFGDLSNNQGTQRYLATFLEGLHFWGAKVDVSTGVALKRDAWQMVTAVRTAGTLALFLDSREVGRAKVTLADAAGEIHLAPKNSWKNGDPFLGKIALFTLQPKALTSAEIRKLWEEKPNFDALVYESSKKTWPMENKVPQRGLGEAYQKPEDFPKPSAPASKAVKSAAAPCTGLRVSPDGGWVIAGPWKLKEAPAIQAAPEILSKPGFDTATWIPATVPGTVLTTLVDQGVYPDPYYGLNNLVIPESLCRQEYWYRVEFASPKTYRNVSLIFQGINYRAEVWLNGTRLGEIKGAFRRGIYNIGPLLKTGTNALAVRVSPPPHPGVPHEESISGGPGGNGGSMCKDGPTFFCSEGWDWIPGIRDRNTGIWQNVVLRETGAVSIRDPQVVTDLPLPDTSRAAVTISAELRNSDDRPQTGTLRGEIEGVEFEKTITLPPKSVQTVTVTPAEFPQLEVRQPRLWWPNGYGKPELYHLRLSFVDESGRESDAVPVRFGIREMTFELTAIDPVKERTERLEFSPTAAGSTMVVDHRHAATIETSEGWVPTLAGAAEKFPSLTPSNDKATAPFLVIKVNGQRIAVRGGNWGMDEGMKRVSRERLEPYMRLQREANMNMIRNWCGQSTEAVLFDLCDEYGLLVWNDFWLSTQNINLEPDDNELFLDNAADTIKRFRNHPSVAIWCGRNEGVPPEVLNAGLDELVRTLDGTRYYQPNSRHINLSTSGPWRYNEPAAYFTSIALGFSTEVGLPCAPAADAIRAMMPAAALWPINDTWAYHDWHRGAGGDVKPFMDWMARQLGEPKDLDDFCRKAQMMNYESHRAMFEGMNALLWNPSSGRLMWMSHPSWPSMAWQLYSSNYETAGAYFGVKKACEFLHVQMNLPNRELCVVNTTLSPVPGARVIATIYDQTGAPDPARTETVDLQANSARTLFRIEPRKESPLHFVRLELRDAEGALLSENFYWLASSDEGYAALRSLPKVTLTAAARRTGNRIELEISNPSKSMAVQVSVTLRCAAEDKPILPAYASDNYFSLPPGANRALSIEVPEDLPETPFVVALDGWNVTPLNLSVKEVQNQ
jgi:hypothetical protein